MYQVSFIIQIDIFYSESRLKKQHFVATEEGECCGQRDQDGLDGRCRHRRGRWTEGWMGQAQVHLFDSDEILNRDSGSRYGALYKGASFHVCVFLTSWLSGVPFTF